jgi:WD40 repeat protein
MASCTGFWLTTRYSPSGSWTLRAGETDVTGGITRVGDEMVRWALYEAANVPTGRILTASEDNTARLWNSNGKPLATLQGHTRAVWSAVFAPDGASILTASDPRFQC